MLTLHEVQKAFLKTFPEGAGVKMKHAVKNRNEISFSIRWLRICQQMAQQLILNLPLTEKVNHSLSLPMNT